jgi:alpha-ketoglutarate-dependent taurine dioxygenase
VDLQIPEDLAGPPVMDLRYDSAKTSVDGRPAYFTSDRFPLHTDLSYVPLPPRILLMQCVHPGFPGEGDTLLSDCRLAQESLTIGAVRTLEGKWFRFHFPPGCQTGNSGLQSILRTSGSRKLWAFRRDGMEIPAHAQSAVQALVEALEASMIKIRLDRGDLLIVDNHRVAHGRTAFHATGNGPARHLRRTYSQDWM